MADKVLITGGAGFIGSHLVDNFVNTGYQVAVIDNLLQQVHGSASKAADGWPIYLHPEAERIKGDVRDADLMEKSLQGVTHLVHLAASVGVGQSMINIVDYTHNNAVGAAVILEVISNIKHNICKIVVASSMSIYGEGSSLNPATNRLVASPHRSTEQLLRRDWELYEGDVQLEPIPTSEEKELRPSSVYAINKRDHEEMFLSVGRALDIPTIALRLFNVFGSRQALSNPYTGVVAIFASRLLNGKPPLLYEDGAQRRDFVHVNDVAHAFLIALEDQEKRWETYNVGSGKYMTIRDIAVTVAGALRKDIEPEVLGIFRTGDIRHCFADVQKIKADLSYAPSQSFGDSLNEMLDWISTLQIPSDGLDASIAELVRRGLTI